MTQLYTCLTSGSWLNSAPQCCTATHPLSASPLLPLPPPRPTGVISLPCMKSLLARHSLLPPSPSLWRACTPSHNGANHQIPTVRESNSSLIPLHLSILSFPPASNLSLQRVQLPARATALLLIFHTNIQSTD